MKRWSIPAVIASLFGLITLLLMPWHVFASHPSPVSHYVPAGLADPADWPMYGHDPQRTNYNPAETAISESNYNSLAQRWVFNLGSSSPTSGAPSVANGRVYAGSSITSGDNFFALDAVTGSGIWSTSVGHGNNCFSVGIGSSSAVSGTVLSVGGGDQAFYGLNADTGGQLWREPMNVGTSGFPWASPLLAYGRSYLGMASCADNPSVRGEVRAIDMNSGANLGSQYFVPPANRGAGIWNSPALSPDGSALVVATGEDYAGYNGPYNRAIVSLDPITLAIMQSNQQGSTGGDLDYAATPIFFSDSLGRTLVGGLHKNGTFYAYELNSINNGPIWSRSMGGYIAGMMPAYDPTFGAGGTLFVANSRLYALDPQTGQDRWPFVTVGTLHGNMAIANGLIFLNVAGNLQIRSEANNGALLRTITPAITGSTYTGPVVSHGFVYWLSGAWLNAWSLPDVVTPTLTPSPVPPTATPTNTVLPTGTPISPTPTVTCCGTLAVGVNPNCSVNQNGTVNFFASVRIYNNSCPFPVEAEAYVVLQVSADYVNWPDIAQSPLRTFTVPPAPAFYDIGEEFPDQNVPPEYIWYRFQAVVTESNGCHQYGWTSQPQFICRLATATVTSTSVIPTVTNTSAATSTPLVTSTATTASTTATSTVGITTSTPTPCAVAFADVPAGHTFHPFVMCLACRGIISGYSDGTFRPNNEVTRGQLAKIVSNAAGYTESPDPQIFEDVTPANTFYQWINRLARRGHMSGYPCGGVGEPCLSGMPYFRPFANATRGQTSKIVSNAAGFNEEPTDQTFEDVPTTHTFYREIQRLASRGIMAGYPCGGPGEPCLSGKPYFRPQNNVTRGQSAKIVANTFFPACQTP